MIGGGGIAGLASLRELLCTDATGRSTVGETVPHDRFFEVVGFEQKPEIGGTWFTDGFKKDPAMPPQDVLDTERYSEVRVLKPSHSHFPSADLLEAHSATVPYCTEKDPKYCNWSSTAVWPRLYTNVPESYTRYSTAQKTEVSPEELAPFLTHEQLRQRLLDFAKQEHVKSLIRFNTEVYDVVKDRDEWVLTLRSWNDKYDLWYQERFEYVVLAQGSFSIPFIPQIKGLSSYVKHRPGAVLHAKAYTEPDDFRDKRVVIVGGNISAIDLGQYLQPVCKEVIVSRNLARDPYLPYMDRCINSFRNMEMIKEFRHETGELVLSDGTVLRDVDHVILATGYHIELPFLQPGILRYSIPADCNAPTSNSRIKGLYQHVFNIEDPSLVFVGKLIVQTLFRQMESQAAAAVGFWTGKKKLPSKEEMYAWEKKRLAQVEEHLFHKYNIYTLKEDFFDPMRKLHLDGRPDPLRDDLLASMVSYDESLEKFERLFNEFRTGDRDVHYNFNNQ